MDGVEKIAYQPNLFNESTGIWIALLIFVLRIVKGFMDRGWMAGLATLPEKKQLRYFKLMETKTPITAMIIEAYGRQTGTMIEQSEEDFLRNPYGSAYIMMFTEDFKAAIRWGLLAGLFLPLGLSLNIIYFWIIPIATGLIVTFNSLKKYR